jgi:hypothetical protein
MIPTERRAIGLLVAYCAFLLVSTAALAYSTRRDRDTTFLAWLDADNSTKSVVVGLVGGVVFGLIDNTLLYMGIAALEKQLRRLPFGADDTVMAGYGNAVSGAFSALVATFAGRAVSDLTGADLEKSPLWTTSLGFLVGGVVGVLVPRLIVQGGAAK